MSEDQAKSKHKLDTDHYSLSGKSGLMAYKNTDFFNSISQAIAHVGPLSQLIRELPENIAANIGCYDDQDRRKHHMYVNLYFISYIFWLRFIISIFCWIHFLAPCRGFYSIFFKVSSNK